MVPRRSPSVGRPSPSSGSSWGLAAVAQTARISVLTYDGYRRSFTATPGNPFFEEHACSTGYVQAMHIVDASNGNIYAPLLYRPPGSPHVRRGVYGPPRRARAAGPSAGVKGS